MLRFLRHIRKSLLEKNKLRTYLLYAIGEIFLVVIGILIALQINNWNESQIQAKAEINLLSALRTDLQSAINESKEYYLQDSLSVKNLEIFLLEPNGLEILAQNAHLDSLINEAVFGVQTNIPRVQVFEDLKNSGNTTLIRNRQIRNTLAELDLNYEVLEFQINDKMTVQQNRVDDLVIDYLNFKISALKILNRPMENEWSPDYGAILSDKEAVNVLSMKIRISEYVFRSRKNLQATMEELTTLIDAELASR